MRFCERKDLIDRKSYVAQYVALALFSVGSTTLIGSDDLLSAFASGSAFAWDGFFNKQTEDSAFSSVIDLLFNIAGAVLPLFTLLHCSPISLAFIYIGAWMPFHLFSSPVLTLSVWRLVVLAILVLILRRLPVVLGLYRWIPDIKTFREAVFLGTCPPICKMRDLTCKYHRTLWAYWCGCDLYQYPCCPTASASQQPSSKSGGVPRSKHSAHRSFHGTLQCRCSWPEYTILFPRKTCALGVSYLESTSKHRSYDWSRVGDSDNTRHTSGGRGG